MPQLSGKEGAELRVPGLQPLPAFVPDRVPGGRFPLLNIVNDGRSHLGENGLPQVAISGTVLGTRGKTHMQAKSLELLKVQEGTGSKGPGEFSVR